MTLYSLENSPLLTCSTLVIQKERKEGRQPLLGYKVQKNGALAITNNAWMPKEPSYIQSIPKGMFN